MKKVFQTIIDKDKGNCLQAAIASLFDQELDSVPNFIDFRDEWFHVLNKFVEEQGYEIHGTLYNKQAGLLDGTVNDNYEDRLDYIKELKGVNGYFYAAVHSPKFKKFKKTHAVIIDKDFNIIHDPNPEYQGRKTYPLSKKIGHNGVLRVLMIEKKEEI